MKCLAVQQPWAWAICAGFKRIENRSWQTPYRGPLAIVASGKQTEAKHALKEFLGGPLPADTLTYSAIIGTAVLSDVVPLGAAVEDDPHAFGPYCWVMTDPKWFQTPIPTSGKLKLYPPTPSEEKQIAREAALPGRPTADPVLAAFARSIEASPFDRGLAQGDDYRANGQWADLERLNARLLALDPTRPEPYFFLAHLDLAAGRFTDALAAATRAIELDPNWAVAHLARAEVYEAMRDRDWNRALELDPSLADEDGDGDEDEE